MNDHDIDQLTKDFPLGIRVNFRWHIKQLQNSKMENTEKVSKVPSAVTNENIGSDFSKPLPTKTLQTSESIKTIQNIELILQQSVCGTEIINYYKENSTLTDSLRNKLVDKIIDYFINNDIKMQIPIAKDVAEKIVQLFPNESMVTISVILLKIDCFVFFLYFLNI